MNWVVAALVSLLFSVGFAASGWPGGSASAEDRTERIEFATGRSAASVRGEVIGDGGIDYLVRVRAGQRLAATLRSDNPSNVFTIKARGASEALFIGSIAGNLGDVIVPSSGDYVIEVSLMRNAARRGERASFSLTVEVTGGTPGAPPPDFADGLSGGPDVWEVANLPPGDRLNIRTGPSSTAKVIARVGTGVVLRNLGCRMTGTTRWCQVEWDEGNSRGWAAGRYLIEARG